jgi:pimeloyl-ACP methyl ester carboxylesterase
MALAAQITLCAVLAAGTITYYRLSTRPAPVSKPTSTTYPSITTSTRTITTHEGRAVGFAEYGSTFPEARVLLFFHGLPGSRIIPVAGLKEQCERKNIRLIAIDRPGIGLTSPASNDESAFDASPCDVIEVLVELGVSTAGTKIGVIGYSMGGPQALRLCHLFPDLADHLHLIAPASFFVHPKGYTRSPEWSSFWETHSQSLVDEMCPPNRTAHRLARWAPIVLTTVWALKSPSLVRGDDYVNNVIKTTSPGDRAALTPEDRDLWALTTRETFRQGIPGFLKAILETFGKSSPNGWGWDVRDSFILGTDYRATVKKYFYAARTDMLTPLTGAVDLADLTGARTEHFKIYDSDIGHLALLRVTLGDILEQEGTLTESLNTSTSFSSQ